MPRKLPTRDPVAAYRRKAMAIRRVGLDARCLCGERKPEALIAGSRPVICAKCQRLANGQATIDEHHFAGKRNSSVTIPVPVNDHRAHLNSAQADWPKSTLRNVSGSPLLAAAACVRGFVDTMLYLVEEGLLTVAAMLEELDKFQVRKMGSKWWINTEVERFAPKKKGPDAQS